MPVNFSTDVYLPAQDLFGRTITVTPLASQPGGQPYTARGILDVDAMDVDAMDGSIISETRVILDIREVEFAVLPLQGDIIDVPADSGLPAEGSFEVIDADPNGGGETTLTLRRWCLPSHEQQLCHDRARCHAEPRQGDAELYRLQVWHQQGRANAAGKNPVRRHLFHQ